MALGLIGFLVLARTTQPVVGDLAWMAGDWTCQQWGGTYEEHWSKPAGGSMIGHARLIKNGKAATRELDRIEETETGLVLFVELNPKGERPGTVTSFPLKEMTKDKVVFENLKHDYPQRVIYFKKSDGTIAARIEGNGSPSVDFPYRKG